MPRKIILVGAKGTEGGDIELTYCFWSPVSSSMREFYINPTFVSAVPNVTAMEAAALSSGYAIEVKRSKVIPSTMAISAVKDSLIEEYSRVGVYQTSISVTSIPTVSWDGTTWSS